MLRGADNEANNGEPVGDCDEEGREADACADKGGQMSFEHVVFRVFQVFLHFVWFVAPIALCTASTQAHNDDKPDKAAWYGLFGLLSQVSIVVAYCLATNGCAP